MNATRTILLLSSSLIVNCSKASDDVGRLCEAAAQGPEATDAFVPTDSKFGLTWKTLTSMGMTGRYGTLRHTLRAEFGLDGWECQPLADIWGAAALREETRRCSDIRAERCRSTQERCDLLRSTVSGGFVDAIQRRLSEWSDEELKADGIPPGRRRKILDRTTRNILAATTKPDNPIHQLAIDFGKKLGCGMNPREPLKYTATRCNGVGDLIVKAGGVVLEQYSVQMSKAALSLKVKPKKVLTLGTGLSKRFNANDSAIVSRVDDLIHLTNCTER